MYIEELMESENFDGLFLHQIIEESIIDACTTGDDKLIDAIFTYLSGLTLNLLHNHCGEVSACFGCLLALWNCFSQLSWISIR